MKRKFSSFNIVMFILCIAGIALVAAPYFTSVFAGELLGQAKTYTSNLFLYDLLNKDILETVKNFKDFNSFVGYPGFIGLMMIVTIAVSGIGFILNTLSIGLSKSKAMCNIAAFFNLLVILVFVFFGIVMCHMVALVEIDKIGGGIEGIASIKELFRGSIAGIVYLVLAGIALITFLICLIFKRSSKK